MITANTIRVFISYSHDSPESKQMVLDLANRLRDDGIDCRLDRYVQAPPEGWQRWMLHQIDQARFTLIICTQAYCRRFAGTEDLGVGKGATWEAQIIGQMLYQRNTLNERFIPVLPDGLSEDVIPTILRTYTTYRYPSNYSDLYRQLTNQPEVIAPDLGQIKPMPPLAAVSTGAPQTIKVPYDYDVFFVHGPEETVDASQLIDRLTREGIKSCKFQSPRLGEELDRSIAENLRTSKNCAILFGRSGDNPGQNEEFRALLWNRIETSNEEFQAIPILLPDAERPSRSTLPGYLTSVPWVEFRFKLDDNHAYRQLYYRISGKESDSDAPLVDLENPYRGLQVFDVNDDRFFFGREAQTQWLLEKLRSSFGRRQESRFLAILGPSGSGKSSLGRAGLLSALKRGEIEGSAEWLYAVCRPGADPLESLAVAMADTASQVQDLRTLGQTIAQLGQDYRTLHLSSRLAMRRHPERQLVIFIDQFEEVFTVCENENLRQAFFDNIFYAANSVQGQTVVVITMRTDFYGKCSSYPNLAATLSDRQMLVGAMSRSELRSAIERPCQLAGCEFEIGLVTTLLADAENESGALPLLQHVLLELWKKRAGRVLTYDAYEAVGRLEGALEQRAEEVYQRLSEHEQMLCRRILLRLTQPGEGTEDTKRRATLRELGAKEENNEIDSIISVLTAPDCRLLTTDKDKGIGGEPVVEISHEALIRSWTRLRGWIEESRQSLRIQRQLTAAAAEWEANARNDSFLYSGARLANALEWAELQNEDLNDEEREFLEASKETDARERGLSDSATLDQLEASAQSVWLRFPEMNVWLARARELTTALPDHMRQLENILRELDQISGTAIDSASKAQFWRDTLKVFVRRLELFTRGLLAAAEHVVEVTPKIEEFTIAIAREQWETAIKAIENTDTAPQYKGLKIKPQVGLVPIGPDPISGLWEFAHLASGSVPQRDSDNKIMRTEAMGIILVLIPGGAFQMGATMPSEDHPLGTSNVDSYARDEEQPVHTVKLDPFLVSRFPMTQGQFLRATGTNPSYWKTKIGEARNEISLLHPVECVSWNECLQAIKGLGLCLPTEAQWEYAARSGTSTIWWRGNHPGDVVGTANLLGCRETVYPFATPTPVGLFDSPNHFGLEDVAGNVWEWCRDPYGSYALSVSESDGLRQVTNGTNYVCRGGSFFNTVDYGRSAVRYFQAPADARFSNLGLRPARKLDR
jgi:formylglycine-generating enzyme required for sulfatase activity